MPTRPLPTLALSALLLLAACGPSVTTDTQGETMTMSMKDLAKLGKNYTCTFADVDDEGNRTEGTVYVEGETNFRGEFGMMQGGKMMHSTMIRAGNTSYMWSEEEPGGIMMTIEEDDDSLFGLEGDDSDEELDEDEPVEMKCRSWPPNRNMFEPPSGRKFTDMNAQLEMMQKVELPQGADVCAACDQAPDAASKAQCRQALGC